MSMLVFYVTYCRAPRGARGLKLVDIAAVIVGLQSCPSRGTWIEIREVLKRQREAVVVPLAGHVD